MLAQIASYFWPSKRSARRRIFGFSAFASLFVLWAICGHELSIASLSLPWLAIALYYVLIWWLRGYFDHRRLAWAYQEAESASYAPAPETKPTRRPLHLPQKPD